MGAGFYAAMMVLDYHKVNGTRDRDDSDTFVVAQIVPNRGREGSTGTYVEESNA